MMDEKLREKLQKNFICFYLQRKRNELRSRRNLVRFLELKLKNKQRLIKACLELFVQYVNVYHHSRIYMMEDAFVLVEETIKAWDGGTP